MSRVPTRVAAGLSIVVIALTGVAAAQTDPPTEAAKEHNRLEAVPSIQFQADSNVFQMFGPASPTFREQSERFRDPVQRAAFRAEQRAQIMESHQTVGELLELDAATESKLFDLLADFQTNDLEQFYTTAAARASQRNPFEPLTARAERETVKVQALRELLGQEKLERYQVFATLVNDYRQVAKLNERLEAAHKLTIDQQQRLAQLWHEQIHGEIYNTRFSLHRQNPFAGPLGQMGQMPSREDMMRNSQLMTIASNEDNWRRMPKADEQLRQRAAEFLTASQLASLALMNAEKADNLRKWIIGARAEAGLSPEIPEQPEATEPPTPMPMAGAVKLAVKLTINGGEATHYTDTLRNGESATFQSAEGLIVEVRPTIYDNDMFDVRVLYYEPNSRGGRRLIGEGGQMGKVTRDNQSGGTGGSVITGNKGYAIEMSTKVEPA